MADSLACSKTKSQFFVAIHLQTVSQCIHKQSMNKPSLALSLLTFYCHLIFTAPEYLFFYFHTVKLNFLVSRCVTICIITCTSIIRVCPMICTEESAVETQCAKSIILPAHEHKPSAVQERSEKGYKFNKY